MLEDHICVQHLQLQSKQQVVRAALQCTAKQAIVDTRKAVI